MKANNDSDQITGVKRMNITEADMESEMKTVSFEMPLQVHNKIKAEASLQDTTKNKLFNTLIALALKHYKS